MDITAYTGRLARSPVHRRVFAFVLAVVTFLALSTLGAQRAHAVTTYTKYLSVQLMVNGVACTTGRATLFVTWHDWGTEVSSTNIALQNNVGRGLTKTDAWATRGSTPLEHYPRYNGVDIPNTNSVDIQNDNDPEYTHGKPAYIVVVVHATTRPGCARTFSVST
jgi:hypothetical protein